MISNSVQVNQAYQNALNSVSENESKANALLDTGANPNGDFGSMVSDTVNQIINTGKNADDKMMAQAVGKVDVVDVVTAVAETEVAVQTLVSVRDRVISAYQDILRMPV